MLARPAVYIGGFGAPAAGGRPYLDQKGIQVNATNGNATLTAMNLLTGVLNRTVVGAPFTDTWPTADSLIAAIENPQIGDSWLTWYRNAVAFAMTFAAGTGIVSGIGTLNCAASSSKLYLHTILSTKRSTILVATTLNASGVLSNLTNAQIATIEPGMGATGVGIGASAVVLGVTPSDSPIGATVTLSVVSTASADNIPVSFFPRVQVDALGVMTN